MSLRLVLLEEFGKAFVPKKIRPNLRTYLLKANIYPIPYNFFGAIFYLTALMTGGLYLFFIYPFIKGASPFMVPVFTFVSWILVQGIIVTLFILTIKIYIDLKIYYRTRELESMLPDFLQVVSSNLKGGMPFENALWASIKPRFKILSNEMAEVSKKVMTGYEIRDALVEFSEKYDSQMLRRSVDLIISEIESGGNIARLIDKIVDNLKNIKVLKQDMAASALSYVLFISIIVICIAPLLFSLSYSLLVIISNFMGNVASATEGVSALPMSLGAVNIDLGIYNNFSMTIITLISFFSSLIVSIVEKGDLKAGIKYIPLFTLGSLLFYWLFRAILDGLFSGLYSL